MVVFAYHQKAYSPNSKTFVLFFQSENKFQVRNLYRHTYLYVYMYM